MGQARQAGGASVEPKGRRELRAMESRIVERDVGEAVVECLGRGRPPSCSRGRGTMGLSGYALKGLGLESAAGGANQDSQGPPIASRGPPRRETCLTPTARERGTQPCCAGSIESQLTLDRDAVQ